MHKVEPAPRLITEDSHVEEKGFIDRNNSTAVEAELLCLMGSFSLLPYVN